MGGRGAGRPFHLIDMAHDRAHCARRGTGHLDGAYLTRRVVGGVVAPRPTARSSTWCALVTRTVPTRRGSAVDGRRASPLAAARRASVMSVPSESVAEQNVPAKKPRGCGGEDGAKKIMDDAIIAGAKRRTPEAVWSHPSTEMLEKRPKPAMKRTAAQLAQDEANQAAKRRHDVFVLLRAKMAEKAVVEEVA
mgnify:CR=1 FL=1